MAAPTDAENDPGSHYAHDAEPTDEATVPASHFEHDKDPAVSYLPGPQSVQMEAALAPTAAESLPATHSVQTVAVMASEYFQAWQSSHAVLMPATALYFQATQLSARNICGVCVCLFVCVATVLEAAKPALNSSIT